VNPARRRAIFERLRAANPHPKTELEYSTPFELLVAVVLSAQATDKSVNVATRRLFPIARTPEAIVALGVEGLSQYVRSIGLYQGKARNVVATARLLLERHGGRVPEDRESLEALPGVGRKTANVILNTAFGEPTIAVDTHLFRVANRTGLAPGKTVRAVEDRLLAAVPAEFLRDAHHWLILHGRYVCKARNPACPSCPIADLCEYRAKTPANAPKGEYQPSRPGRGTVTVTPARGTATVTLARPANATTAVRSRRRAATRRTRPA
jgi:endonuclease-3